MCTPNFYESIKALLLEAMPYDNEGFCDRIKTLSDTEKNELKISAQELYDKLENVSEVLRQNRSYENSFWHAKVGLAQIGMWKIIDKR